MDRLSKAVFSAVCASIKHSRAFVTRNGKFAHDVSQHAGPMKRYSQVAAYILAGGASSRMGREKGLLEIGGEPLIIRTARLVEPLVTEVTFVGPAERYSALGLRAIADQPLRGREGLQVVRTPLAGIATALNATKMPWNLILACDLPYLTAPWLDWLLARAIDSEAQIVMPRTSRGLEPLTAVYRSECAAPIVAALDRGVRKVTDAMAEFRTEQLLESNWQVHEPHGRALKNMNTLSDYEDAKQFLEREFSPLE